jgi:hypothetical protein
MIHIQNPFSFFWPDGNALAKAEIEIRDSTGTLVKLASVVIEPFGTLALSVRSLFHDAILPELGTITIDLIPPKQYVHYLRKFADGVPITASPFWMRFFSTENGSQGFTHSIEADRAKPRGISKFAARYVFPKEIGTFWESHRTIDLTSSHSALGIIVNYSSSELELDLSWVGNQGRIVAEKKSVLPPRGILKLETPIGCSDLVFLRATRLPTPNAKPYVFVFNKSGQFGFTHG